MNSVKNLPASLHEIAIAQIIFDHSDWVSLWGYMILEGQKSRMDFILTFDTLNKLLRLSGKMGDQVQMMLVDQLETGLKEPTILDLEEQCGGPLHFNQCHIEVSPTSIQDKGGQWRTDPNCLSIDGVRPLLQRKNPVISPESTYKQNLSKCAGILCGLYELYLGYLELGYEEELALQKAELLDDLKFKMAFYTWQLERAA